MQTEEQQERRWPEAWFAWGWLWCMWAVWPGIHVAWVNCMYVSSIEVTCSMDASWPIMFTDSISTAFWCDVRFLSGINSHRENNDSNIKVTKVWGHSIYAVLALCIIVLMHFILSVINIILIVKRCSCLVYSNVHNLIKLSNSHLLTSGMFSWALWWRNGVQVLSHCHRREEYV